MRQRMRSRLIRAGAIALVGAIALSPRAAAADERLAAVLRHWTTAVMGHSPGTSDSAVAAVWAMTPADRAVIRGSLPVFLRFLDGADFSRAQGDLLTVAEAARSLFPLSRS